MKLGGEKGKTVFEPNGQKGRRKFAVSGLTDLRQLVSTVAEPSEKVR